MPEVNAASRSLLIVRAGDKSLHPHWLQGLDPGERTWDLHISYFGDRSDPYPSNVQGVTLTREKGAKFPGIATCLEKLGSRIQEYDFVGFPDDDLLCDGRNWNRFFEIIRERRPAVSQPALHNNSFFTFNGLLQRRRYSLRMTNFIEVMTPVFSAEALALVRGCFDENQSGWGLDFLWPALVAPTGGEMCVVDEAPVLHTRAVGVGPLYSLLNSGTSTPHEDKKALLAKYGLQEHPFRVLSALTRDGKMVPGGWAAERPLRAPALMQKVRRWRGVRQLAVPEPSLAG